MLNLVFLIQLSNAYFAPGSCPTPALQSNFNLANYLGLWYDLVHTTDFFWELGGECDTAQYSPSSKAGSIVVYNSEYKNNAWSSYQGSASCQSSAPSHCSVKFFPLAPAGDYEVVQTDYTNYSFVFSCTPSGTGHDMFFWILARSKTYNYNSLLPLITQLGFPQSEIEVTVQNGCPNPPTPPSNNEFLANY